jgi:hypothetical protein
MRESVLFFANNLGACVLICMLSSFTVNLLT